jgi:hypothetical protein
MWKKTFIAIVIFFIVMLVSQRIFYERKAKEERAYFDRKLATEIKWREEVITREQKRCEEMVTALSTVHDALGFSASTRYDSRTNNCYDKSKDAQEILAEHDIHNIISFNQRIYFIHIFWGYIHGCKNLI